MQKLFENWRGYTDEPESEVLNEGPFDFLDPYTKPYKRIYKKTREKWKRYKVLKRKAERKARGKSAAARRRLAKLYKPESYKGKTMIKQIFDHITTSNTPRAREARQTASQSDIAQFAKETYKEMYSGHPNRKGSLQDLILKIPIKHISKKDLKKFPVKDPHTPYGVYVPPDQIPGGWEASRYGLILITNRYFWEFSPLYVGVKGKIRPKDIATPGPEDVRRDVGKDEFSAGKYAWDDYINTVRHELAHAIDAYYQRIYRDRYMSDEVMDMLKKASGKTGEEVEAAGDALRVAGLSPDDAVRLGEAGTLSELQLDKLKKVYQQTLKYSNVSKWKDRPWEVYAEVVSLQMKLGRPVTVEELSKICVIKVPHTDKKFHTEELYSKTGGYVWEETKAWQRWWRGAGRGKASVETYRASTFLGRGHHESGLVKNIQDELLKQLVNSGWNRHLLYNNLIVRNIQCWPTQAMVNTLNSIAQVRIKKTQGQGQKGRRKPIGIPAQKIVAENKILKLKLIL